MEMVISYGLKVGLAVYSILFICIKYKSFIFLVRHKNTLYNAGIISSTSTSLCVYRPSDSIT